MGDIVTTKNKGEGLSKAIKVYTQPLFIQLFLFFLLGLYVALNNPKGTFLVYLNGYNTPFLDTFFKYITHFGDTLIYLVPLVYLLYKGEKKKIFKLVLLLVVQTFFSWLFKFVLAKNIMRPAGYFSTDFFATLHKVPGVNIHTHNTFPSGHTMTAFAVAFFCIYTYKKMPKAYQFLLVNLAILVGISRVYILQHFLIDIVAGAFLGIISAALVTSISLQKDTKLIHGKLRFKRS